MDRDITVNSITYGYNFDVPGKAQRSSALRGKNSQDILTTMQSSVSDKQTGSRKTRTVVRLDQEYVQSELLAAHRNSAYIVYEISGLASDAEIAYLDANIRAIVATTAPDVIDGATSGKL